MEREEEARRTKARKEQGTEASKEQAHMTKHFFITSILQSGTLLIIQLLQPLGQAVAQVLWISNSKLRRIRIWMVLPQGTMKKDRIQATVLNP